MKKTLLLIIFGLLFGSQKTIEMIPYRIIPSHDDCHIEIEIIDPITFSGMVKVHAIETEEIILDRIVYELTNPFAQNEIFIIDGKHYYLLRIPYTGTLWK